MGPTTRAQILVREASLDDYGQVCVLLDGLDELHRDRLPWLFRAPESQPRSRDYFAELLASDDAAVFVAEAGEIVGVAIALARSAPDLAVFIPQRWVVLDGIVVSPAWRRRGVGVLLVRAVESWAAAKSAAWVELGVYEFNAEARAFYATLGYLPVSTKLRRPLP